MSFTNPKKDINAFISDQAQWSDMTMQNGYSEMSRAAKKKLTDFVKGKRTFPEAFKRILYHFPNQKAELAKINAKIGKL